MMLEPLGVQVIQTTITTRMSGPQAVLVLRCLDLVLERSDAVLLLGGREELLQARAYRLKLEGAIRRQDPSLLPVDTLHDDDNPGPSEPDDED